MAFEELKENVEDIQDKAEAYIESNLAYYKLRTFKCDEVNDDDFKIFVDSIGI
jgi:hypothetical protein